jgi:hypothetical protein
MALLSHPETKERHFQDSSVMELIAERIGGVGYGDQVEVNAAEVAIGLVKGRAQLGMAAASYSPPFAAALLKRSPASRSAPAARM